MIDQECVQILNELLSREQRSFAVRLVESKAFVNESTAPRLALVQRMAETSERQCAALADQILALGGGITPCTCTDPTSADLHYLELGHVLPRLLTDEEALAGVYEAAASRLEEEPPAAELANRIRAHHRENVETLRKAG